MAAVGAVLVCLSLPSIEAQIPVGPPAAFGKVIPLPGHINELIFDEARGQLYAANFSAGRVEIISAATNQRIGSFLPNTSPSALSAMAMSRDGAYLVVTEVFAPTDPTSRHGLTVINLNDPGDRRHYVLPVDQQPLALAFGNDNLALVVTTTNMQLFDPVDGSLTVLFDYEFIEVAAASPGIDLPVPLPTFPREIHFANATSTRDGHYIYGTADSFVFSYDPVGRLGFLTIRQTETLVQAPLFQQVSASDDGSYFMAGQLLFDNRLTVLADTLEAPIERDQGLFGGHVIDDEIDTIYASFDNPVELAPGQQVGAILNVMDADNLYVRKRIRITEQLQGGAWSFPTMDNTCTESASPVSYICPYRSFQRLLRLMSVRKTADCCMSSTTVSRNRKVGPSASKRTAGLPRSLRSGQWFPARRQSYPVSRSNPTRALLRPTCALPSVPV